jgi:myo-inositol-1(or 4)-monophosphatase
MTAHGFPQFCVSIVYERRGRVELRRCSMRFRRELFVAARCSGARPKARPIHVSATPSLDRVVLATSFPYERRNFYSPSERPS